MKQKIEIKVSKLVTKVESQIIQLINEVSRDEEDNITDISEYRKKGNHERYHQNRWDARKRF